MVRPYPEIRQNQKVTDSIHGPVRSLSNDRGGSRGPLKGAVYAVSPQKAFQGSEGVAGRNEREPSFLRGVIDLPSRQTNEGLFEAGRLPCTDLGLAF